MKTTLRYILFTFLFLFIFNMNTNADTVKYCQYKKGSAHCSNAVCGVSSSLTNGLSNITETVGSWFGANWSFYDKDKLQEGASKFTVVNIIDKDGTAEVEIPKSSQYFLNVTGHLDSSVFYSNGEFTCPATVYANYQGQSSDGYLLIDVYSSRSNVDSWSVYNEFNKQGNVKEKDSSDEEFTTVPTSCEGMLGTFKVDLENILKIMRILGPILVVVFSLVDYLSAIVQKDDDSVKKANSKLVKRLVLVVLLFFLPIILDIILGIVDTSYTTCIR